MTSHTPWGAAIDFRRREVRHSSPRTRCTGCSNTASTACASTPCTPSPSRLARRDGRRGARDRRARAAMFISCSRTKATPPPPAPRDFDAQWNDDGHHVLHVLLTGESDGYYERLRRAAPPSGSRAAWPRVSSSGRALGHRGGKPRGTPSARSAAHRLRAVPAEPRPDRQPRVRRPADRACAIPRRSRRRSPCSCSARRSRCCSWARKARARRRSCSSPTMTANWPVPCATAGAASSRISQQFSDPEQLDHIPDPNAPDTFGRSMPAADPAAGRRPRTSSTNG